MLSLERANANTATHNLSHGVRINFGQFDSEFLKWNAILEEVLMDTRLENHEAGFTYSKFLHQSLKNGEFAWDSVEEARDRFEPSLRKIITGIFDRYVKEAATVLELGSNEIDDQGESYLSNLIPDKYKNSFTYSDAIDHVVSEGQEKTKRRYLKINAKKMDSQVPKESLDVIVSLSVLDVLPRDKIKNVAQGAFKGLRSGGCMIILNDKKIYSSSLLEKYISTENFAIYWVGYEFAKSCLSKGIKYAPRKMVEEEIKKTTMPKKYKEFFVKFLNLNILQMQDFLNKSYQNNLRIFECLDNFFPSQSTTYVDEVESYRQDVVIDLTKAGFKIPFAGKIRDEAIGPRVKDWETVESDMGKMFLAQESQEKLQDNEMKVVSNVHAIIAIKP